MTRLEYFEVDCVSGARLPGGVVARALAQTAPQHITPGIPGLEDLPLDHGSKHRFSDHMQTLRPGCYDVIATPVDPSGVADPSCKSAQRSNVVVQEGKTGEIVLINQCTRPGTGGLDSIVVRNHPPTLVDISFESSKFGICSQDVVVCATATDPDGDPLTFEWQQIETDAPSLGQGIPVLQSMSSMAGTHKECVRYRPNALGRYDIKVQAFDLARVNGELVKFGEITEEGHVSKAELDFFFYSVPDAAGLGDVKAPELQGQKKSGILILASSVSGGENSQEAFAARSVLEQIRLDTPKDAEGKEAPVERVDILSDEVWTSRSLRDFSGYRAIIVGDPNCGDTPPTIPQLWTAAVNGNVLIYGSNPSRHGQLEVIEKAIAFASEDDTRTGAYISTSCYYHSAPSGTVMNWVSAFGERGATNQEEGAFSVVHAGGCPNEASVIAGLDFDVQGNVVGYSNALLSKWGCSAHNFFTGWPENFKPMALMTDYGQFSRTTGYPGEPYILARGAHLNSCGNGEVEIGEECDDGNRIDGDDCDRSCSREECGDGFLQGNEYCDDGNDINGDGCDEFCQLEAVDDCNPPESVELAAPF